MNYPSRKKPNTNSHLLSVLITTAQIFNLKRLHCYFLSSFHIYFDKNVEIIDEFLKLDFILVIISFQKKIQTLRTIEHTPTFPQTTDCIAHGGNVSQII